MTKATVRYDHDDATDTEISVEIGGVKHRFETIAAAANFLHVDAVDLLDALEAVNGETTIDLN